MPDNPEKRIPDWATGLLATQGIALGIALAMPITPSKTGSTWSPAHLFWAAPSYLQEVVLSFVLVNLVLLVLGLIVWIVSRSGGPE